MTGNPRRGRFSTETPLERERRLEIQGEQRRKGRQQETRGAERTSLRTAKATPSTRDRGSQDNAANRIRNESDEAEEKQRLKFTVKIILLL